MAAGNVTLDTTWLENSFQAVRQALGDLAQQQMANTTLSRTLVQQQRERAPGVHYWIIMLHYLGVCLPLLAH